MIEARTGYRLCQLRDIADRGSKGFVLDTARGAREIFVVRWADRVSAYENHCPHTGAPLNWKPDEFLSWDRLYIQCSIHGAQFRISDGYCEWGPCLRQSLTAVAVQVIDEAVVLA